MNNLQKFLKKPSIIEALRKLGLLNSLNDRTYLTLLFKARVGYWPDLDNPVTYNEKLQWIKLYDRNPFCSTLCDKYLVRSYVKDKIGEEYLDDKTFGELRDYKFFCFGGVCKYLFIATDRFKAGGETKMDYFDMDFNHLKIRWIHPNAEVTPDKPQNFELMKRLAAVLSQGLPQARVDFYEVNGKVYFGEITFFTASGFKPFDPPEWDKTFGDLIDLSSVAKQED